MGKKWRRWISAVIIFAMSLNLIQATAWAEEICIVEDNSDGGSLENVFSGDTVGTSETGGGTDILGIEIVEEESPAQISRPDQEEEIGAEAAENGNTAGETGGNTVSSDTQETEAGGTVLSDAEEAGEVIFSTETSEAGGKEDSGEIFIEAAEITEFPMYEIEKAQMDDADYGISAAAVEPAPQDGDRYTVIVFDHSGSMSGEPMQVAQKAVQKFCSSMMNANGKNYVAIVAYGSGASVLHNYSDDLESLTAGISGLRATGGTDTNSALLLAKDLIDTAPEGAVKNIVLLSDGLPESGATSSEGPYTSKDDSVYYRYANKVYETAQEIKETCNLYSLGFFHSLSGKELEFGQKLMEDIQNKGYYDVKNADDLEFAFGEVSDSITESTLRKIFINQHKEYIKSNDYKTQIIGGFDEYLSQILNDVNNDIGVKGYNLLDGINKALDMDLNSTNEYELLLAQLMINDQSYKGIQESFQTNLQDVTFDMMDIINKSIEESVQAYGDREIRKNLEEIFKKMMPTKYLSNSFMELQNQYFQALSKMKIDSKKLKIYLDTYDFAIGSFIDTFDVAEASLSDTFNYIAYGEAYIKTSEDFTAVLTCMDQYVNELLAKMRAEEYLFGPEKQLEQLKESMELSSLRNAIEKFISSMEAYKEDHAKAISDFVASSLKDGTIDKVGENFIEILGDKVVDLVSSEFPIVKLIPILKTGLKLGQLITDIFTKIDDSAAAANMVKKLYCMAIILDEVVDRSSVQVMINDSVFWGPTGDIPFRNAVIFDESVNIYKTCIMLACDYGITYEECCLNSFFSTKEKKSWYSTAISIAALDKMLTQNISCHSAGLLYDHKTNVLTYDQTKLQVVTIACPVAVSVADTSGRQIAYLLDGQKDVVSGYEHYFHTFEDRNNAGDYVKIAVIPEGYRISIAGTGTGTMDVYTGTYDSSSGEVEETGIYEDIPVSETSSGTLARNQEEVYELNVDGEKIENEHTHTWDAGTVTSEPSCTEPGIRTYVCAVCKERKEEEIPAVGHDWDAGEITQEPSGTKDGVKTYTCQLCGETKTEPVPAVQISLSDADITGPEAFYEYTGAVIRPQVTVTLDGETLKEGTDYIVMNTESADVGRKELVVHGTGAYTGDVVKTFDVVPASVSGARIIGLKTYVYNGKVRKPAVTVTLGGKVLKKGRDYRIAYTNSANVGAKNVKITGIGNYTGSLKKAFQVVPRKAVISRITAGVRKLSVRVKAQKGARYQIQYRAAGAKRWSSVNSLSAGRVITGLKRGKRYIVRVRAYKAIGGKRVNGAWSAARTTAKVR